MRFLIQQINCFRYLTIHLFVLKIKIKTKNHYICHISKTDIVEI